MVYSSRSTNSATIPSGCAGYLAGMTFLASLSWKENFSSSFRRLALSASEQRMTTLRLPPGSLGVTGLTWRRVVSRMTPPAASIAGRDAAQPGGWFREHRSSDDASDDGIFRTGSPLQVPSPLGDHVPWTQHQDRPLIQEFQSCDGSWRSCQSPSRSSGCSDAWPSSLWQSRWRNGAAHQTALSLSGWEVAAILWQISR